VCSLTSSPPLPTPGPDSRPLQSPNAPGPSGNDQAPGPYGGPAVSYTQVVDGTSTRQVQVNGSGGTDASQTGSPAPSSTQAGSSSSGGNNSGNGKQLGIAITCSILGAGVLIALAVWLFTRWLRKKRRGNALFDEADIRCGCFYSESSCSCRSLC
jgi:hypothetical protein